MKRLQLINLFGVLALAALCVMQWRRDRQLNLEINRLEQTRLEQASRLAVEEQSKRGLDADLAQLKESFLKMQQNLNEARAQLQAAEREALRTAAQRDELKAGVTNWAGAVANRDELLKQANARIRQLADELNVSIRRFNDLATNHNVLVRELNDLRARSAPPQPAAK